MREATGPLLFDTGFLVRHYKGHEGVAAYLERTEGRRRLTTTINLKEVMVGLRNYAGIETPSFSEVRSDFGWLRVFPFDAEHAWRASELEAPLHRDDGTNRAKINQLTADLLIAAVAAEEGATVVTRNDDDFDRFDIDTAWPTGL
jgi:predicted nucleic acid-binding protein